MLSAQEFQLVWALLSFDTLQEQCRGAQRYSPVCRGFAAPGNLGSGPHRFSRELLGRRIARGQLVFYREHSRFDARGGVEFGEDVAHVQFYGVVADVEGAGDGFVALSLGQVAEDFAFALGEQQRRMR